MAVKVAELSVISERSLIFAKWLVALYPAVLLFLLTNFIEFVKWIRALGYERA